MKKININDTNPEELLEAIKDGFDVNAKDESGCTPLMCASYFSTHPKVVELLIEHGANVNAKDEDGRTALFYAGRHKIPEVIELLLKHGAKE